MMLGQRIAISEALPEQSEMDQFEIWQFIELYSDGHLDNRRSRVAWELLAALCRSDPACAFCGTVFSHRSRSHPREIVGCSAVSRLTLTSDAWHHLYPSFTESKPRSPVGNLSGWQAASHSDKILALASKDARGYRLTRKRCVGQDLERTYLNTGLPLGTNSGTMHHETAANQRASCHRSHH